MIERIYDSNQVRAFVSAPDIWDKISQDGQNSDGFCMDNRAGWLSYKVNDKVVAVFCFDECQGPQARFHPHVLEEYKLDHAYVSCREALEYAFDVVGTKKIVAQVPFMYRSVYNFALKLGFREEGINRKSFLKNGKLWDQWHLGMVRGELK